MRILHSGDFHLGRTLYGKKRYQEFAAFLEWLGNLIDAQNVDALLVAGDVFDTTTASNRSQELYYKFLRRVARSCCKNIVIIAGNHDSPTFLDAARDILSELNVYVVGSARETIEDEIFVLRDNDDIPEAIVAAVPYLRDRDIRVAKIGESIEDKAKNLVDGVRNHYRKVCDIAEQKRLNLLGEFPDKLDTSSVPIIAMGHLFASGGRTQDGDGVRELYVGSLAHVGKEIFPDSIDYLALGHLHVAQKVANQEHLRYSGSPLPCSFGESEQQKKVLLVEFEGRSPCVQEITVPCFKKLERIKGDAKDILAAIELLKTQKSSAWLEIEYDAQEIASNLRSLIEDALEGSLLEVCRIINKRVVARVLESSGEIETLEELTTSDVFNRCLDAHHVPDSQRGELIELYEEIVRLSYEE